MRLTYGKPLGEVKIVTGTRKVLTFNGTQMKRPPSGGNLELGFSRNIEVWSFAKVSEVTFAMSRQPTRMADSKKVSGELFSLTYGALVAQIVKVDGHHLDWSMVQWLVHTHLFPRITRMSMTWIGNWSAWVTTLVWESLRTSWPEQDPTSAMISGTLPRRWNLHLENVWRKRKSDQTIFRPSLIPLL